MSENICDNPFVAAAEYARRHGHVLCIGADEGDCAELRKQLAKEDGRLPQVISVSKLQAAAAAGASASQLIDAAHATASTGAFQRRLTIQIYEILREMSESPPKKNMALAESLANLLSDIVTEHPGLPASEWLKKIPDEYQAEVEFIKLLWESLPVNELFSARKTLEEFAHIAPPVVYVAGGARSPWHDSFLRECKECEVFATESVEHVKQYLSGEFISFPNINHCRQGNASSTGRAAKLALSAVCDFRAEGKTVGIVVYDRVLARRLRALAESKHILIEDEGGWRMNTLSFGGALRQWATAVSSFSPSEVGSLLSPPYWADESQARNKAESAWQKRLSYGGVLPHGWDKFKSNDDEFIFAERMTESRRRRPKKACLREWTEWLLTESESALSAWRDDEVAARARASLAMAADGNTTFSPAEFNAWLDMMMRNQTGGERDIKSEVCFVPPTTSRRFDALLLLGARHGDLPSSPVPPGSFLREREREYVGLPNRRQHVERQFAQFWKLITTHESIAAVWQNDKEGQPVACSPFWTVLTESLTKSGIFVDDIPMPPAESPADKLSPPPQPAPIPTISKSPKKIHITAIGQLMKCPYDFFASNILKVGEDDGDEILTPAQRGRMVHRAMEKFATLVSPEETSPEVIAKGLHVAFKTLHTARGESRMYLSYWRAQIESLAEFESRRRKDGWRIKETEYGVNEKIEIDGGADVELSGRIDRIDVKGGEWSVIDYKSGSAPSNKRMREGEAPQLPLYAALLGQPDAHWEIHLPTKPEDSTNTFQNRKMDDQARTKRANEIAKHARELIKQIFSGAAPLTANGSECELCSSRRLCRREHWASSSSKKDKITS